MTRYFIAIGLLLIGVASAVPTDVTEPPPTPPNRHERWQGYLDEWEWHFSPDQASAVYCFQQYDGATRLQMVFDSTKSRDVKFLFGKDGELLELHGHGGSVFRQKDNVLFFASYAKSSQGCTITAYDLRNGKQLWETPLQVLKSVSHSAYSNEINLGLPSGDSGKDHALCVTGHESHGDYKAILDLETGEILAQRVYREGWK
jgi:hypothetical protein